MTKRKYWIDGVRHGKRWVGMDHGMVITDETIVKSLVAAYNRYVTMWNVVEGSLCGFSGHPWVHCLLNVHYDISLPQNEIAMQSDYDNDPSRGFDPNAFRAIITTRRHDKFFPQWSTFKNALRAEHVSKVVLHFTYGGVEAFHEWLDKERREYAHVVPEADIYVRSVGGLKPVDPILRKAIADLKSRDLTLVAQLMMARQ